MIYRSWLSIDKYWAKVFKKTTDLGQPMCPTLSKLVKCVIIIAHGNADVERGFSANASIVTPNRSALNASSVSGLWTIQDAVRQSRSGSHRCQNNTSYVAGSSAGTFEIQVRSGIKRPSATKSTSQQAANDAAHQEMSLKHKDLADKENQLQSEIDATEKLMSDS